MQMDENKILTTLGMMSGTSMDGIDVAILRTDGEAIIEPVFSAEFPYDSDFRDQIGFALEEAKTLDNSPARTSGLRALEVEITRRHIKAVEATLKQAAMNRGDIDLIGFHGQTVLHRPDKGFTVQLGDGEQLADAVGIPVVSDMRSNDMAHGGQGAPLVPAYHGALAASLHSTMPTAISAGSPVAFVNIGGISNLTYIGGDGELIAFDTGPGNNLIDQWVANTGGKAFDENGTIAADGNIVEAITKKYLDQSFFGNSVPKSLDRSDFSPLEQGAASLADGARTLAHISAASIFKACEHLPAIPHLWIISGGGRKNPHIIADLKEFAAEQNNGRVLLAEEVGLNGDTMEAEAWAWMAVRSLKGLPLTYPKTTGCSKPVTGGHLSEPKTGKMAS